MSKRKVYSVRLNDREAAELRKHGSGITDAIRHLLFNRPAPLPPPPTISESIRNAERSFITDAEGNTYELVPVTQNTYPSPTTEGHRAAVAWRTDRKGEQ